MLGRTMTTSLCLASLCALLSFLPGADGLLKLWNVKDAECVNTFDGHEDKVHVVGAITSCVAFLAA